MGDAKVLEFMVERKVIEHSTFALPSTGWRRPRRDGSTPTRDSGIRLTKAIENERQEVRFDSRAGGVTKHASSSSSQHKEKTAY